MDCRIVFGRKLAQGGVDRPRRLEGDLPVNRTKRQVAIVSLLGNVVGEQANKESEICVCMCVWLNCKLEGWCSGVWFDRLEMIDLRVPESEEGHLSAKHRALGSSPTRCVELGRYRGDPCLAIT